MREVVNRFNLRNKELYLKSISAILMDLKTNGRPIL
jgi:hypothetical protein